MFKKLSKGIKKVLVEFIEKKTTMAEMKNTLNGINGKLDITEEKISELEDREIATIQNETWREKGIFKNRKQYQ